MNMIFDTLEISEKLKSAKFTKAQTDTLIDIYRHQNEQVVTKDDLIAARGAMKDDLIAVKSDLEAKIESTNNSLKAEIDKQSLSTRADINAAMIKMMGFQLATAGLIVALVKLI